MKALNTRVGSYVTGDAIADAVLRYSVALTHLERVDLVDVPFRTASGAVARAQLKVGWLVDIDSVTQENNGEPELTDPTITEDLRARESALQVRGDTPLTADDLPGPVGGLDEY